MIRRRALALALTALASAAALPAAEPDNGPAPTLDAYASVEGAFRWLAFDRDEVPAFARAGKEILPEARLRAGALLGAFPLTVEASLSYEAGASYPVLDSLYAAWFFEAFSFDLGRREAVWGLGRRYQPLRVIDLVEDAPAGSADYAPRYWQAGGVLYAGPHALRFRGLAGDGLVGVPVLSEEDGGDWFAFVASDEASVGPLVFAAQVAALSAEGGARFVVGSEASWLVGPSLTLAGSVAAAAPLEGEPWSGATYRGLASAEAAFPEAGIFLSAEGGFDGTVWSASALAAWVSADGRWASGVSLARELARAAWAGEASLSCAPADSFRVSLSCAASWGDDASPLVDGLVPASLALGFKTTVR
ncbi:MAG: hypothetical protein JXA15_12120 [Spirochaetales bacterium]|nr:hypothetical protein [Spirochaetales bacterium]